MEGSTPNRKRKRDKSPHRIIIACDFGTTFSGAAWAHTADCDNQQIITQWPNAVTGGLDGMSSGKVPTELQYDDDRIRWGLEVISGIPRQAWFKLDLGNTDRLRLFSLSHEFSDPRILPPSYNPEKTVTDYLTLFRKHIEQHIQRTLPSVALETTPISYCLTVPAIWNERAQAKTLACAKAAGMGAEDQVLMISEPEAAATFVLDRLNPHGLEVGSTFVLCDAGGGTVDLISYTILELEPVLKVQEAAPGTGGMCGSTFINRIFAKRLEKKLSHHEQWDADVMDEALERFEHIIKQRFAGSLDEEHLVPVPGLSDNAELGIRRGKVKLDGATVNGIFERVLDEVVTLVKGQIRSTQTRIKAILLVGGFGQSLALRQAVCEAVKNDEIEVIQPAKGWTCVVAGALMRALEHTFPHNGGMRVTERRARKHYGFGRAIPYDPLRHDENHKFWDAYRGQWYASEVGWVVEKGGLIKESEPARFPMTDHERVALGHPKKAVFPIYCCPEPEHHGTPRHRSDAGVVPLATITWNLRRVPLADFRVEKGEDNQDYYTIPFTLKVTFLSGATRFEIVHNGRRYSELDIEFA